MATAVITGRSGKVSTSPDGVTWTAQTSTIPGSDAGFTAAHRPGQFLIGGSHNVLSSSPDGVAWTDQNSAMTGATNIRGAAWNGSLWVICNDNGKVSTSPDGVTWTPRTTGLLTACNDVIWVGELGKFFIVQGTQIVTSPDGITWTVGVTIPTILQVLWITWSSNLGRLLLGGSYNGPVDNLVSTSPDGTTWTTHLSGFGNFTSSGGGFQTPHGAAWSPALGLFAIAGGQIGTSPDGSTWTICTDPAGTSGINRVRWLGALGMFIACADGGKLVVSTDGVTWSLGTPGFGTTDIEDVACTEAGGWTVGSIRN